MHYTFLKARNSTPEGKQLLLWHKTSLIYFFKKLLLDTIFLGTLKAAEGKEGKQKQLRRAVEEKKGKRKQNKYEKGKTILMKISLNNFFTSKIYYQV